MVYPSSETPINTYEFMKKVVTRTFLYCRVQNVDYIILTHSIQIQGGRIIDNLQIDNHNLQIDNLQIDNKQITFFRAFSDMYTVQYNGGFTVQYNVLPGLLFWDLVLI